MRFRSSRWNARPNNSIRPASGRRKSRMVRISVVLPAPFGPSRPKIPPARTSNDTLSSATVRSNRFETAST